MKRLDIYILICLLLTLYSCKPLEDQVGYTDDPVFFVRSANGNAIQLVAGKNGYYHFTAHSTDELGVLEFAGDFSKDSCENCDEELKIIFRAAHPIADGETMNISDHIRAGDYDYAQNLTLTRHRKLQFTTDTTLNPNARYLWNFGDGHVSTDKVPNHEYSHDASYMVSLEYVDGNCATFTRKQVHIQADSMPSICQADFQYSFIPPNTFQFQGNDTAYGGLFFWDFGDGTYSLEPNPQHSYVGNGVYNVSLVVERTVLACSSLVTKSIVTGNSLPQPCPNNFSFNNAPPTAVDSMHLSNVIVQYRSREGEEYSSDVLLQDDSYFRIMNVSPYENNEQGQAVIVFDIDFSCRLRSTNGNEINFGPNKGHMGVSYPK